MNSRHSCFEASRSNAGGEARTALRRPSGRLRPGGTESLQRGAAAFVGHGRSGSPVSSTYSRVCTDRVYHFCVQKPVQAHEAAFPRSNRLLRARAGVSRVPVLSRDFREPVPPVSPTSLISQGSRRVERQFVPAVPVSADLYARTRTRTRIESLEKAVQLVQDVLSPDQIRFQAVLGRVREVEHREPRAGEAARTSRLNWAFSLRRRARACTEKSGTNRYEKESPGEQTLIVG